jgi:hypothetical protein
MNLIMKNYLLLLAGTALIAGTACQEQVDIEKEKEAIVKVLYEEGKAFAANDIEGVFALHVQDELSTRYDGNEIYAGWDKIKSMYEAYIEANTQDTVNTWTNPRNEKENIIVKVTGNTAWLICDNIWKFEFNNEPQEWSNIQIAFLEKLNGDWKFAFNAFISPPPAAEDTEESPAEM